MIYRSSDTWWDMGYIIRRGEVSHRRSHSRGVALFNRDQVQRRDNYRSRGRWVFVQD